MKSNQRNDQLERFFQHNPIEDPLYLKKYVKEHPDHKMAWYLLGREYTAQGKEGKAAYCFAQAGEIYEAFEQQKIKLDGPLPSSAIASMLQKETLPVKKYSGMRGRLLLFLVMFLLLALPAGKDLARSDVHDRAVDDQPVTAKTIGPPSQVGDSSAMKLVFSEGNWGKKLQEILSTSSKGAGETILMEAPASSDGKWMEWNRKVSPLLSVEGSGNTENEAVLKYYQAQICSCQVADSSKVTPAISSWVQDREQASVLQSTIQAYQMKNGQLPDKPEQLTKPYPDNLLPGLTPQMKEAFPEAVQRVAKLAANKGDGTKTPTQEVPVSEPATNASAQSAASSSQPKSSAAPLAEPLRIIIDTDQHQLAVVSGQFILRRYPVGLGGAKTPQGDFIISEKVRNPNGKSNGEFGSRGMTLSDSLYAIHGTNNPSSIGKDESHGCVRMLQADVEELYNMVPQMTKVTIGKGDLPPSAAGSGEGSGIGAGGGNPNRTLSLPLETKDNNPNKRYKWLD
ncbi:hypothetical protein A8709_29435 [Paenibacillus pectinilyticus]|uniref:L,D-TPase catalytic domain-containing protein n=1 Tax=Paenibacillus pectinilyticus TaxID=512399 RepID=A0A1C0ZV44_9BACL|nr:L,D-transpeptidase [Paenibacillus pectinilyticus]OCT11982.1 hypothetical protein A8709_29435 [Paenibacillus pectinilyticus]